jgi:hypothetical protein
VSNAKPRTLVWLAANPVILLTIAGAGFYAAVRFGQKTFYSRLGLTPEDVGLGRIETLTLAIGLAFYLVVFAAILVGLPTLASWVALRIGRVAVWPARSPRFARATLIAVVLFFSVSTGFFSIVWFWGQATAAANDVEAGKPVRLSFLSDTGIHAEKARITWIGDAPKALTDLPTHKLMFLGQSGGTVVLYDVDDKRSIRIPSSNVAVLILP